MSTIDEKLLDEALVEEAYERVKADLDAVPEDQLMQLNVDVHAAARTILGALPEMRALRGRLAQALPEFDAEAFDKLEDYVWALRHAQATYYIATQPPDDLEEMTEEGTKLRDRMIADMNALQAFGLIGPKALESLKGGLGYNNLAIDLDILCRAMKEEWTKISARAHTTREEVTRAFRISARLTRIAGLREQGPARLAAATELRMRAFTVLLRTYDEARDAIGYLRRHQDDVDSIAPSLYPGRSRRREVETVPVTPVPVPTTTPGGTTTPPTSPASGVPPAPAARVVDDRGPFLT